MQAITYIYNAYISKQKLEKIRENNSNLLHAIGMCSTVAILFSLL